jgi:hypothetical protein
VVYDVAHRLALQRWPGHFFELSGGFRAMDPPGFL